MRNFSTRRLSLAVASVAGVAALSMLSACGSDETASDPAASATPTESTPSATPTEQTSPSETATASSSAPVTPTSEAPVSADTLITLAQPTDGQVVTTDSFAVSGTANSPEANVPWTLTNAQGEVVAQGGFTAEGWMDKLYPYSSSVGVKTLPAGAYTFTVAVADESDGESKLPNQSVSVTVTVKK